MKRLGVCLVLALLGGIGCFALFSTPTNAQSTIDSDLTVNINSMLSLALANCPTAPDLDNTSLTLDVGPPSPSGTFKSNCQVVTVDTNAPGYSLSAKATGSHPDLPGTSSPNTNLGDPTNALIYQNPLPSSLTSPPVIPATVHNINSPDTIANNTWGFAVISTGPNSVTLNPPIDSFTSSGSNYTQLTNDQNDYANLPTTDTTIHQTTDFDPNPNNFDFYYAVKLTDATLAGTYQTTITYTATSNDIPQVLTHCGTLDYECIMYTVDMGLASNPGTHNIGTWGGVANIWDHAYDWNIFVDDQPIADCNGSNRCSGDDSSDITISVPIGIHQIKILPHNGPEPGWGNAFVSGGYDEIITIDAPLTTMAFAPKPSESTTSAKYMFNYLFQGHPNLTTSASIIDTYKLPSTITDLSEFLSEIHSSSYNITTPIDLSGLDGWLDGNNSITNLSRFLNATHAGHWSLGSNLETPIDLTPLSGWFSGNNSIKDIPDFLRMVHSKNDQLVTPIDLTPISGWFNANNSITNFSSFLNSTHEDKTSLTAPIDLTPISGWFNANNLMTELGSFIPSTHSNNTSLTAPIDLTPISGWFNANNSITNFTGFLNGAHSDNTNLTTPIDLTPISGWFDANESVTNFTYFLVNTHQRNDILSTPIDLTPISGWFNANNSITNFDYFLRSIHSDNPELTTPIDLTPISGWFNANNSITSMIYFLNFVHSDNPELTTPIDLTPISGWFNANESVTNLTGFLNYTHYANAKLIAPLNLTPLANWFNNNTSVTNLYYFLQYAHSNNEILSTPINLTPLSGWFSSGRSFFSLNSFLSQTHYNNPNLTLSGQIILPNWLKTATIGGTPIQNIGGAFDRTFYMPSTKTGDSGEPRFQDGTVLSSVGAAGSNRQTYTNRSGITPLTSNWK